MIEEYIVYADEHEVLIQVIKNTIVSAGPLLRPYIGKKIKVLEQKAKEERWILRRIQQ